MSSSTSNPVNLISTKESLAAFLTSFPSPGTTTLYIDLEGTNLCRHGTIDIIAILLHPQKTAHLIDVHVLGRQAFASSSLDGKTTLKSILENPAIPKCLWDVRNDADALWSLYGIKLTSVLDIQLLENASRIGGKSYLCGLDKAVRLNLQLGFKEINRWIRTKNDVRALMPKNSSIFEKRPMDENVIQYCVGDVVHLPKLRDVYEKRITGSWLAKAKAESAKRLVEARSSDYDPQGRTKAFGPWKEEQERAEREYENFLDSIEDAALEERANEFFADDL